MTTSGSQGMKRLYRSETDVKIAGVCGGIAEVFSIDPTLVRLVVVIAALVTVVVPFVVGYLVAWWIVPTKSELAART
jgi:phage shock protein C